MEEGEVVSIPSRKELRKQKLMEYLAAKGKLKEPNLKACSSAPSSRWRPRRPPTSPVLRAGPVHDVLSVASSLKAIGKENKTERFGCGEYKIPNLDVQSTLHPARKVFSVRNNANAKTSILSGHQFTSIRSATSEPAQPKSNPALTTRCTVVSFKSNIDRTRHVKRQSDAGLKCSDRVSSNVLHTAVTKSSSRHSSRSNATWSYPNKMVSSRISLGPLVKTKTGLVPAVTKPRSSPSQTQKHVSATATDATATSVTNRLQLSTSVSLTASQRSATAQKKALSAAHNAVGDKITVSLPAGAKMKVQGQNKSNSNLHLDKHCQPSSKSQLPKGQKPVFKITVLPNKQEGRVSKHNKPAAEPTDRATNKRCDIYAEKIGQQCKVPSQTAREPASRNVQAVVVEQGRKTKTFTQRDGKKGHTSAQTPQTCIKRTGAPVKSQTVPKLAVRSTDRKMTKIPARVVPQTEGKKQTAAQEERMRKLQEWREAKGISYKRPPMQVKPQVKHTAPDFKPFWATMKEEDEASSLICAMDRSLADCIKLLGDGCPPEQVKAVLSRLPAVSHKFARYWICQARLMEREGNLDVLPMFEEAVRVVLEPVDELRTVVFEILKKKDETQASEDNEKEEDEIPVGETTPEIINNPMRTPKPVRALICGEKGDSSVVKYKITATPGGPSSQQREPARVNGQEVRFFTPVRRSVRIERASLRYPASLQDHDLCVASYDDLISKEDKDRIEEETDCETRLSSNDTLMYVYRQNEALKDKVVVKLVCEEGV